MKTKPRLVLAAVLAAVTGWPLSAQPAATANPAPGSSSTPPTNTSTTASTASSGTVELSPFEVSSTRDTGYQATDTLAGTRIRTNLADVGSSIQVITKQFLLDVGATGNLSLLQYTTNTEVAGTLGTYAGLGNGTSVDESATLRNPNTANRVRGLAAADTTRDFYVTDIPWDSFNVDRVDLQRGPNSILFGLGSPAGIINVSTVNADFRNYGSVDFRAGSYGSVRSSIDLNAALIPHLLALRVDGLWDSQKYEQKEAFQNNKRIYGTLRFDPQLLKRDQGQTSIKAKFEYGDTSADRPRTVTPNDSITAYWRPVAVSASNPFSGMGQMPVNNVYDTWRTDAIVAGNGYGQVQPGTANYQPWLSDIANQQQPFWQIDGTTNQLYQAFGGYINNGALSSTGAFTGISNGLVGKYTNGMLYGLTNLPSAALAANLPNAQYGQYRNQSLTDPSIFDFYHHLIDGGTKSEYEHWNAGNIDLSQTALGDRVAIEVSYDRQNYERGGQALLGGSPTITMDVTRNLADYYTLGGNGETTATNPNFGRPFVLGAGNGATGTGNSYSSQRDYKRLSLFGELRADDFLSNPFLVRLLGRHRFNGVASREDYYNENRSWQMFANSQAWAGYWNGNNGSSSAFSDRPPLAVIYLGPSVIGQSSASGAHIPAITAPVTLQNAGVRVFDTTYQNYSVAPSAPWIIPSSLAQVYSPTTAIAQNSNPANYVGWNSSFQDNLVRYNDGQDQSLLTLAQKSLRETGTYSGSYQGYLWNNAFVATLGWRYDQVKTKDVTAQQQPLDRSILNLQPSVYQLPSQFPTSQIVDGHSTSGSAVLHLNQLLPHDPSPINVSLSYDESSNFQVTSVRRDLYGTPLSNPAGKTYDYSILLATKDNKYSLKITQYTTRITGGSAQLGNQGVIGSIIQQGLRWRNVYLYQLGGYDLSSANQPSSRNTWNTVYPNETPDQAQAEEDAAITGWNNIQKTLAAKGFFKAWNFTPTTQSALTDRTTYLANPAAYAPDPSTVYAYSAVAPQGFNVTADTESKGDEFEFTANPLSNWRISINAAKTVATRNNVGGPVLDQYVSYINSQLYNSDGSLTPVGKMAQFGNPTFALAPNVWGPFVTSYTLLKLQQGSAAPEIRKWRFNLVTNYMFDRGLLKGTGVGGGYRWQDKVIIGYPVTSGGSFDLTKPYYGPTDGAVDLWASYEHRMTRTIDWKVQLNVRNAFARNGLIPISIEPDGHTWASVRTKPIQEWTLDNTFSF